MQVPKKGNVVFIESDFLLPSCPTSIISWLSTETKTIQLATGFAKCFLEKENFASELGHKKCQLYQIHSSSKGQCSFIDDGDDYSFDDLNDLFLLLMISMVYSVENWANLIDGMGRGEVGKVTTKIDQVRLFGG